MWFQLSSKKLFPSGTAAGGAQVEAGSFDGQNLAGGEDVVVAVDLGKVEAGCAP
jgi:hypothetical protein